VTNALALQADGKIVLAGYTRLAGRDQFALLRFDTTGNLDPAFGTGGKVATLMGATHAYIRAIAVQPNGRIVARGLCLERHGLGLCPRSL
jgi:uncharacterized delta-60 repeat protein